MLAALVAANARIGAHAEPLTRAERVLMRYPFAIFLAWITVATVANTAQTLLATGWNGAGVPGWMWAVAVRGVATAVGASVAVWLGRRGGLERAAPYALVVAWGLAAIAVAPLTDAAALGSPLVVAAAAVGAVLVAASLAAVRRAV